MAFAILGSMCLCLSNKDLAQGRARGNRRTGDVTGL